MRATHLLLKLLLENTRLHLHRRQRRLLRQRHRQSSPLPYLPALPHLGLAHRSKPPQLQLLPLEIRP
jgi:hypothetical protein